MSLSPGVAIGLMQGGADLGTALSGAYAARQSRKAKQRQEGLDQWGQSADAIIKAPAVDEVAPDTYNRTEVDAFGNRVSVPDIRLPSDVREQFDRGALGADLVDQRAELQRGIDLAEDPRAKGKAQQQLAEFLSSNQEPFAKAQSQRQQAAPVLSTLSQLSAQPKAPVSSAAAQELQQALIGGQAEGVLGDRLPSLLAELQDEAQAERDPRFAQLLQARQQAEALGDIARLQQIDTALAEYGGALDDASVAQQVQGTLPPGHPKAFPVDPFFEGNGLVQAIEQQQFLEQPFEKQYAALLGGEPQRGLPSEVEQARWQELATGLPPHEQVQALQQFAQEREAGGNVFTFADRTKGAQEGRSARSRTAQEAFTEARQAAASQKKVFRFNTDSKRSNSWGAYEHASAKARQDGLTPAEADFVGAFAMHAGHTPLGRDMGGLYKLARVSNAPEFGQVAHEMGMTLPEMKAAARLLSAYGLGSKSSGVGDTVDARLAAKRPKEEKEAESLGLLLQRMLAASPLEQHVSKYGMSQGEPRTVRDPHTGSMVETQSVLGTPPVRQEPPERWEMPPPLIGNPTLPPADE